MRVKAVERGAAVDMAGSRGTRHRPEIIRQPRRGKFSGLGRDVLDRLVVVERAHARRADVVKLATADGPQEGGNGGSGEQNGQRDNDVEDAHADFPLRASSNVRDLNELLTTVSELNGIRRAATSGLSKPAIARPAPMRL